mmetsp:Transcript_2358/g.4517  ORF Transcript_2358/g.4517 Transcript_2358/m.4517 type:complete len:263 (-) Transcript_2358:3091-3879(-)
MLHGFLVGGTLVFLLHQISLLPSRLVPVEQVVARDEVRNDEDRHQDADDYDDSKTVTGDVIAVVIVIGGRSAARYRAGTIERSVPSIRGREDSRGVLELALDGIGAVGGGGDSRGDDGAALLEVGDANGGRGDAEDLGHLLDEVVRELGLGCGRGTEVRKREGDTCRKGRLAFRCGLRGVSDSDRAPVERLDRTVGEAEHAGCFEVLERGDEDGELLPRHGDGGLHDVPRDLLGARGHGERAHVVVESPVARQPLRHVDVDG